MKIENNILKILFQCSIEDNTVFLPKTQLDRKIYLAVNKHLEHIGGKWNRKDKGHVFDSDPTESFENMLLTGETIDFKKELQFFETPPELAKKMVGMAELKEMDLILEPSAGMGAIAKEIAKEINPMQLVCNELNNEMAKLLVKELPFVTNRDFLKKAETYDKIIQNPPFTRQQDIDHIIKAYSLLNSSGILVSVVSESPFFRDNKKSVTFREFLDDVNAEIIKNPEGTFKSSGTMVQTRLVKIVKVE
jgi:predicted RNA methylase